MPIGLHKKSSAPASSPSTLDSTESKAVKRIKNVVDNSLLDFSLRQTSKPLKYGIIQSQIIKAGLSAKDLARPSCPSLATMT